MAPVNERSSSPSSVNPHLRVLSREGAVGADPLAGVDLGHVELQDLLHDILDRVVHALDVDTAVVLLVDAAGRELVARAALGLEEEVRQGVRIRVGDGFAGRVASEGRPLFLDRVDETTVANPILWRRGIKAILGVPLLAGSTVIGVLHVGSLSPRAFEDRDAVVLGLIADRLGVAIRERLLEAERDAAEALQRSLVPSVPGKLGAFECSARYVPAERGGIGGDWYDLFQLDSGEVWLIVGDVAGHGLHAATEMGRLRSTIRSYALLGRGPSEVLGMTDRKMIHFEVGHMATAAVAVFEPPYDQVSIALAGHPPFALLRPGHRPELVDARPGPPLGVPWTRGEPTRIEMPAGSVLVGYTDGLIERRYESIDVGLERLRSAVELGSPDHVCERVMGRCMAGHVPEDDVALIALRRVEPPS